MQESALLLNAAQYLCQTDRKEVKRLDKKERGLLWFGAFYGAIISKALDWVVSNVVVAIKLPPFAYLFATLGTWLLFFLPISLGLFYVLRWLNKVIEI
jgi:hypothetical protein